MAVAAGGQRAVEAVREALTMGAQEGIVLCHQFFDSVSDLYLLARVLSAIIAGAGCDLVVCGWRDKARQDVALGMWIARFLDLPVLARVVAIRLEGRQLEADIKGEHGVRETYQAELPAVVAVEEGCVEPRYVPILSRVYAEGIKKKITSLSLGDLGLHESDLVPLVEVRELGQARPRTKRGVMVTGLSFEEKLRVLRGEVGRSKKVLLREPAEVAARHVVSKISEWL